VLPTSRHDGLRDEKFIGAPAPEWHVLVKPGPKGDPKKALKRADQIIRGEAQPFPQHPNARYSGRGTSVHYAPVPGNHVARPSGVALASPKSRRGKSQRAWLADHPQRPWEPQPRQFTHPRHLRAGRAS
jgi:hypothetical protein